MNDIELLEWSAKAIGIKLNIGQGSPEEGSWIWPINLANGKTWDPLTYDGDAMRLAVKCGIPVRFVFGKDESVSIAFAGDENDHIAEWVKKNGGDPYAATRRAIVRAAAEIGKAMK